MELRDFAEQVLFATTLEEKLQAPEAITDVLPGSPLLLPDSPGRPPELRFKPRGAGKGDFPGLHRLEEERERGRLLHFFANHELLATELMALVLLRFPDAPPAFRKGVLQTLKDEQDHTRLYIERMRECGIQFGELPVSGYFWQAISKMENPMDYVAGLSLTFEQANLDFCRHYSRGFHAVGDTATARLLEGIYRDEIAHVAYGLKWFRRWKNPDESDWEAFRRQLKFPLSPQRAKGITLNIEGRRLAGLDPAFIDQLNVFAQSKGRPPHIFVFNPFTEGRIAHGKSFSPVKHQAQLGADLANLPQFLCRQDDVVLIGKRPSIQFLSEIKQAGFPLPEFIELKEGRLDPADNLSQRNIGALRPWAWGPDSVELLEPLFPRVTADEPGPGRRFNPAIARLYSKAWSAAFLRKILASWKDEPWLCTENEAGVAVHTIEEALEAIAAIRHRGHHKIVVKEALGLAGHNAIRLWEPALLEPQRSWMARALENRRSLVIEPWLERQFDFSVQLEMGREGLKPRGYTGLLNDRKGQFQGNWAAPNYARRIPSNVVSLLSETPAISNLLKRLYADLFFLLEKELQQAGYQGPVGLDGFVYRASNGGCRLKPVVEINPRYTMGRLTLELMQQTTPGSHGLFRLVSLAMARAEGFEDLQAFARSLRERLPLRFEGRPAPKIHSGALCLNDPAEARGCLAVFQVSRALRFQI